MKKKLYCQTFMKIRLLVLVFLGFFLSLPCFSDDLLHFERRRLSDVAAWLTHDSHYRNALFTVSLESVDDYLPEKHNIKSRFVKNLDDKKIPGKGTLKLLRRLIYKEEAVYGKSSPYDFFGSLYGGKIYTYVILQNGLIFTESTNCPCAERCKDKLTKHYFISGLKGTVRFSGTFVVLKNPANGEIFVVLDNGSGTYQPPCEKLSDLKNLLEANFSGAAREGNQKLFFVSKTYKQDVNEEQLFAHGSEPFFEKK